MRIGCMQKNCAALQPSRNRAQRGWNYLLCSSAEAACCDEWCGVVVKYSAVLHRHPMRISFVNLRTVGRRVVGR